MLKEVAKTIRGLAADGVEKANSGHPGLPIGCADIAALLYGEVMKYDADNPDWPDRDRFVLSAGHGSMLVYSLLHLSGHDLSLEDLKEFRQLHSKTPGHPEYNDTPGIETTTGPLGQGFANAVGMALSEEILAAKYNSEGYQIVDHYTYTLTGDGGMMEGISSEAASLAGHLGLGKLIAIYDDNEISIGGNTDITFTEDVGARFKAYDWQVIDGVNGHDIDALRKAVKDAKAEKNKPTLIIAETKIAYGAPTKEGTAAAHGAPLGEEEIKGLKEKIGLPLDKKFYVSETVYDFFNKRKQELQEEKKEWEEKFAAWAEENPGLKKAWDAAMGLELPDNLKDIIENMDLDENSSTRDSSGAILRKMADEIPYLIGGSADLAPSNRSYLDKYDEIQKSNYTGRNIRFGVREHAMGAISNGIVLHGGVRPYCATFLVFTDYMRASMRMAALMKLPVIYIMTHDSIYVGEDGPTHQPVEHVEALRVIPGLKVLRPADEEESKAAWLQAVQRTDGPTVLVMTRQALPHLDKVEGIDGAYKGGYVIEKENNDENLDVCLIGSGSEVSLALETAEKLKEAGKNVRLLSIPDREEFLRQGSDYINSTLGDENALRVVFEAGVKSGWFQLIGKNYHMVTMDSFGASGPGSEVADYFGFTAEKAAAEIMKKL